MAKPNPLDNDNRRRRMLYNDIRNCREIQRQNFNIQDISLCGGNNGNRAYFRGGFQHHLQNERLGLQQTAFQPFWADMPFIQSFMGYFGLSVPAFGRFYEQKISQINNRLNYGIYCDKLCLKKYLGIGK